MFFREFITRYRALTPDANGCLHWHSSKHRPVVRVKPDGAAGSGRTEYISRIVLSTKLGRALREGYFACHTCDDETCISYDHIYEGTPADNMNDKSIRGRARNGSFTKRDRVLRGMKPSPRVGTLRVAMVFHMHRKYPNITIAELAKRCGVSWSVAKGIAGGRTHLKLLTILKAAQ